MNIGIRDLKAHLSEYVEQASNGRSVTVTKHGRVVARIVPAKGEDGVESLVNAGILEKATKPLVLPEPTELKGTGKTASDLVIEGRR